MDVNICQDHFFRQCFGKPAGQYQESGPCPN